MRDTLRFAVVGSGLVGSRSARILADRADAAVALVSRKRDPKPLAGVITLQGWPHPAAADADVVVLATASDQQVELARSLLRQGRHVVTTADGFRDIDQLLGLHPLAVRHRAVLVVGAAYSPGLSTLLATQLAAGFDQVSAIRTAQFGTGGPTCARQHHRATGGLAREITHGKPTLVRGGSGRELVWFPEPIGGADCYRASLSEPLLLHRAFPEVERIESRQAATRRDRLTARLPMLRPPHAEGLVGAVWVEVRGSIDGRIEHRAVAATAPQATGAAAVAAAVAETLADPGSDRGASMLFQPGARTLANVDHTSSLLRSVGSTVRLWTYDGSHVANDNGRTTASRAARKWDLRGEIPTPGVRHRPSGPLEG